jgi:LysM repeat protein
MKPKLILCLAFALSGGLFGCSTNSPIAKTEKFNYPANQDELRLRLAQTIPVKYPSLTVTYEVRVYVIQVNDSVPKILEQFHLTKKQLSKLNPETDLRMIKVGQRLVVYERIY